MGEYKDKHCFQVNMIKDTIHLQSFTVDDMFCFNSQLMRVERYDVIYLKYTLKMKAIMEYTNMSRTWVVKSRTWVVTSRKWVVT